MLIGEVERLCFSRIPEGEDLLEAIRKRADQGGVKAGAFFAIGALRNVVMGCYKNGEYRHIRREGPLEIASCIGNIAANEKGETMIHAHIVVSDENGFALGGHLMKDSLVGVTAELVIFHSTGINLLRVYDDEAKLNLLKLG